MLLFIFWLKGNYLSFGTSKKRNRPDNDEDESVYRYKKKIFVNQRIQDTHDNKKMKEIHAKTITLLFKGANQRYWNTDNQVLSKYNMGESLRLSGDGKIKFLSKEKVINFPNVRLKSRCCQKLALINAECKNCNLELCEFCGSSCIECGSFLCRTCIDLFGCGTLDNPSCESCKMFNYI